jgi:regulator of cell morphogenesis and NO signaling
MKNITADTTVGEIVRAFPARSRVFENLGIDYCCGGKKPLAEVCQKKGLDPTTVVAMLSALDGASRITQADPDTLSLSELCDHIERIHHGYLREELPRLDFMTQKVAAVHGDSEPRLVELRRVFENFNAKVTSHTKEEDESVFPAIRKLETAGADKAVAASWLAGEFEKLEAEHEKTGAALGQFKELTDSYTPPEWACNTFRALYDGLAHLENDMHQHVHEENNVLFPKARALAGNRSGRGGGRPCLSQTLTCGPP